jgi:hypothetical protein
MHYDNDGFMPSIFSALTTAAIAYFTHSRTLSIPWPSKTATAVGKSDYPLCTLKRRLQITIFIKVGVDAEVIENSKLPVIPLVKLL